MFFSPRPPGSLGSVGMPMDVTVSSKAPPRRIRPGPLDWCMCVSQAVFLQPDSHLAPSYLASLFAVAQHAPPRDLGFHFKCHRPGEYRPSSAGRKNLSAASLFFSFFFSLRLSRKTPGLYQPPKSRI